MSIQLEVRGNYVLFSRMEFGIKRISYGVMTPSAARGLVEAVHWYPGLRWIIDRVRVYTPIRFADLRHNETKSALSACLTWTMIGRGRGELYPCVPDDVQ